MEVGIWIVIGLIVLAAVFAILYSRKYKERRTDYKTLFIIGIAWIPIGIATENYAFLAIGIVFMVLGLKNKSKWKETYIEWSDLTPAGKKVRIGLIAAAVIVLLAGLVMYFRNTGKI